MSALAFTDVGRLKVYVVSSGSYSDYTVWCVFERREDAESYAASTRELTVEEYRRRLTLPSSDPDAFGYGGIWVEQYDFYAAGEVPVVE